METPDTATASNWDEAFAEDASTVETPDTPEGSDAPAGGDAAQPEGTDTPSQPTADAGTGSQPEQPETPSGEEPPADPAADGPSQPDDSKTTDEPRPFAYRVDKHEVAVPGAIETQDGWIAIPRDAWNRNVQPYLRDPEAAKRERAEHQRQLAALHPDRNPEVQFARSVSGQIAELKKGGLERVVEWAENFLTQLPVLEARAEAAAAKKQLETHTQQQQGEQRETVIREVAAEMPKALEREVERMLKQPEYAGLGLNAKELAADLWEVRHSIFFEPAEGDEVEDAVEVRHGIHLARGPIQRLIRRTAYEAKRARKSAEEAAKAAAHNAAATASAEAPPAVSAKSAPAPAGRVEKDPETYDEWVESLRS